MAEPTRLEFRSLTVRFGGVTAIDNVGFEVAPGQVVGVVGPNGAGKTTLLNAASGFAAAAEGRVVMDGKDLTRVRPDIRAKHGLARTFQTPRFLAGLSCAEHLRVPAASSERHRRELRSRFDPLELVGLASVASTRVEKLNATERRMLDIARALALRPRVLLMDEPATGMRADDVSRLVEIVGTVAQAHHVSVLVISHDMDLVRDACHDVVVLDRGRVLAEGPPHLVLKAAEVVAAYLGGGEPDEHRE